jgi:hypothetical protein
MRLVISLKSMKALISFCLVLFLFGCSSKEMAPDGITVFYNETQCADPWARSVSNSAIGWPTDEARAQAIVAYLRANKVTSARDVRFIKLNPPASSSNNISLGFAVCQACTCSSGRRIDVTIDEIDWSEAEKLGFKR